MKLDLSPESRGRVALATIAGTAVCIAAALGVDSFTFAGMDTAARTRAIMTDVLLPTVLAVPLLWFFSSKLRELAIAHRKLTIFASTDSLTQVMNRAAFSALVDACLREVHPAAPRSGALLIIDADHFKAVNDRFGHDRGDEALVTIATAIKSSLGARDFVGRLGGEEFGVFLPGADRAQAEMVAERIRSRVHACVFRPGANRHMLSVSVGGAVFEETLPFADLFRLADRELYAAKQSGRNRVSIAATGVDATLAAA